jgi:hypothetical protein
MKEPAIAINGIMLNTAQAMTVRVAIGGMFIELQDADYLQELGPIGPLYKDRLVEILMLMKTTDAS